MGAGAIATGEDIACKNYGQAVVDGVGAVTGGVGAVLGVSGKTAAGLATSGASTGIAVTGDVAPVSGGSCC